MLFHDIPGSIYYLSGYIDVNNTISIIYVDRFGMAYRKQNEGQLNGITDLKIIFPDNVFKIYVTTELNIRPFSAKKAIFDNVVGEEKFNNVFAKTYNLLNQDTLIPNNFINQENGQIVFNETYTASDFIQINNNSVYVLSTTNNNGNQVKDDSGSRWALYNINQVFLAGCVNNGSIDPSISGVIFANGQNLKSVLNNMVYLRVSFASSRIGEQVQIGNQISQYKPYGIQAKTEYLSDALNPIKTTINTDDVIPTTFGPNLVKDYTLSINSSDYQVTNGEYVNMDDGDGVYHNGYLLSTPANGNFFSNAEIVFKFPAIVGKYYIIAASVPYVDNPGPGGRDRFDFEIDFGKLDEFYSTTGIEYRDGITDQTTNSYRYITFGNNDANFSVLWRCKYVDANGYAYVRFGAARKLEIIRNASNRKIIARTWDGISYCKWRGQITGFDVREIYSFTSPVYTKKIAIGNGNGISSTQYIRLQNNNLGIGTDTQSRLFADNGWARNDFDGITMGKSTAGNDKPSTGNIGIGARTHNEATTAFYNVGMGYNAQSHLTNGSMNVAVGRAAGEMITGGMFNVAIGQGAGGCIENGSWNESIGNEAHKILVSGNNNVAIGRRAHNSLETGEGNTVIGSRAGFYPFETRNGIGETLIGFESCRPRFIQNDDKDNISEYPTAIGAHTRSANNAIAIGAFAEANGENSVAIGGGGWFDSGEDAHGKVAANANGAIAIGVDSQGNGAKANENDQIVIGTNLHSIILAGKKLIFNLDGTVTWENIT